MASLDLTVQNIACSINTTCFMAKEKRNVFCVWFGSRQSQILDKWYTAAAVDGGSIYLLGHRSRKSVKLQTTEKLENNQECSSTTLSSHCNHQPTQVWTTVRGQTDYSLQLRDPFHPSPLNSCMTENGF